LSKADIILILFVLLGAYSGYKEGFLMELITLVAIILGVLCGFKLMGEGMILLQNHFNADKSTLPYISFMVIFVIVVVLVQLLGKTIKHSIDKTFLGSADQALGAALGGFRIMFMISIALWITDSLKLSLKHSWTDGSWLYPFVAKLAPQTADWLGGFIPIFKEIFPAF
jgi:membrane protein required for colicin V production